MWFSPRGFLNKDWIDRPQDPIYRDHPDWFTKHAHWFNRYQTLDVFKDAGCMWVNDKLAADRDNYATINGFMFDSFPCMGTVVGGDPKTTLTAKDQQWLTLYSKTIHSKPDGLLMVNGVNALYDARPKYDVLCIENPLGIFLNEVSAGHAVGHSLIVYTRWEQLYYFWTVIAHMYYNICGYDLSMGFIGPAGMGLLDDNEAFKSIDNEIVPLWHIMGKGRRIYGAQIAPDVRHIELRMPDGSVRVVICSLSDRSADVAFTPKHMPADTYRVKAIIDTAARHATKSFDIDLNQTPAVSMKRVPPYSITVLEFAVSP